MLQVLGRVTSINVRKVAWTCEELALPYELQPWGAGVRETQVPQYLALNPNGLVPVLIEPGAAGAFVLWESNTICRYLATREQSSELLPSAARPRAVVEQWMDWMAGELNNAWRYAFMHLVRKSPAHPDPAAAQASALAWNRHMAMLEAQLERTGAFVAGAHFTLADIVLGLAAWRWQMTPITRPALPAVAAWQARLAERPAYHRYANEATP